MKVVKSKKYNSGDYHQFQYIKHILPKGLDNPQKSNRRAKEFRKGNPVEVTEKEFEQLGELAVKFKETKKDGTTSKKLK